MKAIFFALSAMIAMGIGPYMGMQIIHTHYPDQLVSTKLQHPIKISVDPGKVPAHFSVAEVVSGVRYIPLETAPNFVIGIVQKISVREGKILVLDRQRPAVLLFDINGNAMTKFGRAGGGPGDYIFPADAIINTFTQTVDIYSSGPQHKILKYDFYGKFVKEIYLDYKITGFDAVDKDRYVLYRYDYSDGNKAWDYHIIFISQENGQLLRQALPYQFDFNINNEPSYLPKNIFSQTPNGLSMVYWNSETIYHIDDKEVSPKYVFDFGKYTFETQKLLSNRQDLHQVYEAGAVCCLEPVIEMPQHIFFGYRYRDFSGVEAIYSKSTSNIKQFRALQYHNPFNGLQFLLPDCSYGNELVFHTHPFELDAALKEQGDRLIPAEKTKLQTLMKKVNPEGNPILVLYTLKRF